MPLPNDTTNLQITNLALLQQQVQNGQIQDPTIIAQVNSLAAKYADGSIKSLDFINAPTPISPTVVYNTNDVTDNPIYSGGAAPPAPTQPVTTTPTNTGNGTSTGGNTPDPVQNGPSSPTQPNPPDTNQNPGNNPSTGTPNSPSQGDQYNSGATNPPASTNPQGCGSTGMLDKRIKLLRTEDDVLWFFWVDNIFGLLPTSTSSSSSSSSSSSGGVVPPTTVVTSPSD